MVELDDLSRRITTYWQSLGRKLQVAEYVLEEIIENNIQYPRPHQKALQMLKFWHEKGKDSTIAKLAAAVRELYKGRLAEQLEDSDVAGATD